MLTITIGGVTITVPPGNSVVVRQDGQMIASISPTSEMTGVRNEETLVAALKRLHMEAGAPSSRTIANSARGPISHTTVNEALTGKRIPGWQSLLLVVQALGGDSTYFKELWFAAATPSDR